MSFPESPFPALLIALSEEQQALVAGGVVTIRKEQSEEVTTEDSSQQNQEDSSTFDRPFFFGSPFFLAPLLGIKSSNKIKLPQPPRPPKIDF